MRKQTHQDELDRIAIEGKFGQGKRRFSLSRVMCKLARTSETAIMVAFLVMNLEKWLKGHLFCLFFMLQSCLEVGMSPKRDPAGWVLKRVRADVSIRNSLFGNTDGLKIA